MAVTFFFDYELQSKRSVPRLPNVIKKKITISNHWRLTMQKSMELFDRAMVFEPSAKAWCEKLGVSRNTLAAAKVRGKLSPALAGNLAIELGENAEHWIAIAAIEAEKKSPLLERLKKSQALRRKL
jgi:plasmid maintenance system antidote protein VapI